MTHYKSNQRDLEFNLFEVFGAGERMGKGPYVEMDEDVARDVLGEVNRLASGPLSDSFVSSDRVPPVYDPVTKSVTMPSDFKKSFNALMDAEWWRLDLPVHLGGTGAPPSLRWAAAEMLLGANPGAFLFMSGPGFAAILDSLGNEDQKRWGQLMIDKRWGATMVLTEPDAGSDVGVGRTKAVEQADGTWHIEGVKCFITSGEHDMADNIVHLVLARPEGAGPGTKGLSLFVVPKFHVDLATGDIGERNGVYATNVEKKMGLKVSTTCELTFGENEPAVGWLVGDVHNGIAQMFKVIEYARMMVGTKAIATLSTGYLNALEYAKNRVQGADLTQMTDKTAPRVTITNHPDVRRSLMLQKSYSEGMRALVLYTAYWQDLIEMGRAGDTTIDLEMAERINDLLLPIVKGVGSERSYEMLAVGLQTYGGSGYLQDYPLEQYIRDAKIDTLYEGTTAIQGLDFFFRKMVKDQFKSISYLAQEITQTVKGDEGSGQLSVERELLGQALENVQGILGVMGQWAMASQTDVKEVYKVGLNSTRLLMASGDLMIAWLLIRQAEVALAALDAGPKDRDKDFYIGKVESARWFARNRLPLLAAERGIAEATTDEIMEIPESAF
ncbi:MAG: acyl-CoA dehydrogenase [Candidatus Nanopelagicales bacterium]|jgi:alkylation response protein AidB-like acyl-CoA dehydrogenase|nr:acyl-CoA dehydrogenase [Actinomycetota bacterium]MDA9869619.1 acyl-CoA dehydrogenase [bacterium]MDC1474677.1 acyl-CoA dehydrogenase [Candidatus Nanopelagicales bacterium]MBT5501738.1 acyl-CoA dehydrogenase [Actinomycetota bacterium]MBT5805936.1 acyl-CoA dehydrogenase [Actinomycetota bacterium]